MKCITFRLKEDTNVNIAATALRIAISSYDTPERIPGSVRTAATTVNIALLDWTTCEPTLTSARKNARREI